MKRLRNRPLRLRLGRKEEGYMTIEMTIIFPAIFFALLLILFMGIVLYQEVNLQSLAVQASERGAVIYSSRVSDMARGVKTLEDFSIRDPYRNVPFMDGGAKREYIAVVNAYVESRINQGNVLKEKSRNIGNYTEIEDYLIAKRVNVQINRTYRTPVDGIAAMFGMEGPFSVHTGASSAVLDTPEFVRNVDIVTDILSQTEIFGAVQEGYGKIVDAINKAADLLK